jgi:hypothetical protein
MKPDQMDNQLSNQWGPPHYEIIGQSTRMSDSAPFVEFMLEAIREIIENIGSDQATDQVSDQVKRLLRFMDEAFMSTAEMMAGLSLSHRPTFRKNSLPPLSSCWFLLIQVKNQHPLQNQCKAGRNSSGDLPAT